MSVQGSSNESYFAHFHIWHPEALGDQESTDFSVGHTGMSLQGPEGETYTGVWPHEESKRVTLINALFPFPAQATTHLSHCITREERGPDVTHTVPLTKELYYKMKMEQETLHKEIEEGKTRYTLVPGAAGMVTWFAKSSLDFAERFPTGEDSFAHHPEMKEGLKEIASYKFRNCITAVTNIAGDVQVVKNGILGTHTPGHLHSALTSHSARGLVNSIHHYNPRK